MSSFEASVPVQSLRVAWSMASGRDTTLVQDLMIGGPAAAPRAAYLRETLDAYGTPVPQAGNNPSRTLDAHQALEAWNTFQLAADRNGITIGVPGGNDAFVAPSQLLPGEFEVSAIDPAGVTHTWHMLVDADGASPQLLTMLGVARSFSHYLRTNPA